MTINKELKTVDFFIKTILMNQVTTYNIDKTQSSKKQQTQQQHNVSDYYQ